MERSGIYLAPPTQTATIELNTITRSHWAIWVDGYGLVNAHQIGGINKGNVIVGNQVVGITLNNTNGVKIQGNKIGVTSTLQPLANVDSGIWFASPSINTLIGGVIAGEGNTIANGSSSPASGILIGANGYQTTILGNSIYQNAAVGISLGPDRSMPTPNDANDADLTGLTGPQNYPLLASVQTIGATTQIAGTLNSRANRTYRIEAFSNPAAMVESNGYAEGAAYLGFFNVTTNGAGNAIFNVPMAATTLVGDKVTLIATEDLGSGVFGASSEFSLSATVSGSAPGVTVTPMSGLTTTEAGGTATFSVVLDSAPTSNVTINLSSSNAAEGLVSVSSITFTPANWNVAQIITVTGVDNAIDDGDVAYFIYTSAALSSDSGYSGLAVADVALSNTDDDTAGFTIATSGLNTTEAGGTAQFSLQLTSQPTADVTINFSVSDPTEGSISVSSITFTSANWNIAQTVIVTGVDDAIVDGNIAYTITTTRAPTADPVYNNLFVTDVPITNIDNDSAGVTVTPVSGLVTTEAGGTAQFNVALNTQPTADVTINLSSSYSQEGTPNLTTITFTSANWNIAQTVIVTGINDTIVDGNRAYTIVLGAAVSADAAYNGLNPVDVAVTNTDNDTQSTISVTTTSDAADGDTSSLYALLANMGADGFISLREAITATNNTANGSGGADRIVFNIAGTGTQIITLAAALPQISDSLIIDGSTQTDWVQGGFLPVVLDGNNLSVNGLDFSATADNSTVRNLVLRDFNAAAINIASGASGITIAGNWIGAFNSDGSDAGTADTNARGVRVFGNANTIGGSTAADRNVIGDYGFWGAVTLDGAGASGNTVAGNYLGTTVSGNATRTSLSFSGLGVLINNGASNNTIGGPLASSRNIIGGFDTGITLDGDTTDGNVIQNNWIGLGADGSTALPITYTGMALSDGDNTAVGGIGQGNTVVNSAYWGIRLMGSMRGTLVQGNYVGTDAAGTLNAPNADAGILVQTNPLGSTTIGGTFVGQGNVVRNNGTNGIDVQDAAAVNVAILGNTVYGNTALGIDLGATGVTANDSGDGDTGSNNLQNFPVLATARTNASNQLVLAGTLNSTPNSYYRIEFFANTSQDATGYGEGQTYLGFANVATDGSGNASISTTLTANVALGTFISATATKSELSFTAFTDTSEFARNIAAVDSTQATVTVTTASDTSDGDTTSISALLANMGADGFISLREAITATNNTANGSGGADRIHFAISGTGVHTINVASALPTITDAVILDATTDDSFAANGNRPAIVLDGNNGAFDGLQLNASADGSTITGLVVRDFGSSGIGVMAGSDNHRIVGNYIGALDSSGQFAAGEGIGGSAVLLLGSGTTIGGATAAERNVISGAGASGIWIDGATGTTVLGNYIGLAADGSTVIGNAWDGITIANATNNRIGGTAAGEGNRIAGSGDDGIEINAGSGGGNPLLGNTITGSTSLGIDLGGNNNTPLPNDTGDADTGGNNLQNFPVLASANSTGGNTTIIGTFNSNAGTNYRIEFFSSTTGNASGYGEGQVFLGSATVTTDGSGNATISTILTGVSVTAGHVVSATATVDLGGGTYGSTSEFAANVIATASAPSVTVSAISGNTTEAGGTAQFSVVLNTQPTSNVTINLNSSNVAEGTLSTNTLTFTSANWNIAQIVTVTGVDDRFVDNNIAYSIITSPAISADAAYNGLAVADVVLTNVNNDTDNVVVVDTTSDASDGDTSSIAALWANKGADGRISLREAILAANNTVNGSSNDRIIFEITDPLVGGLHTISAQSALPGISDAVFIDGSTDSDFAGTPVIFISGVSAGAGVVGISFISGSSGSGIRSLAIDSFSNLGLSVSSATNITIGGIGFGNVITRNTNGGINVDPGSDSVQIIGNAFGTDLSGTTPLGNGNTNIRLLGGNNAMIGGTAAGAGNIIANSGIGQGISVSTSSTNNAILGNSIFNNFLLGIDLSATGVEPNDTGDSDTGANDLQNYPVLTSAVSTGGNTTIVGSLNSNANTSYRIEFFSRTPGDPSGHGEGRTFLGFTNVTTDALGNATFNANFTGISVAVGTSVSATATVDLGGGNYGSTSEFALNVLASAAPPGVTVSAPTATTTTEAGGTSQFTVVLNSAPSANVTITLSLSDGSEASLSTTTLVFTAANWNVAQTVIVTGVDDSFVDGNIAYSVITSNAVSSDIAYSGMLVADVALTNNDNDTFNTLVVDTTADTVDGSDTSSIAALYANKGADGQISLREAILAANNTINGSQRDSILFNITDPLVGGAHTINVLSQLPSITDAVFIDGSSEPDFGAAHVVELRGDLAGAATGLVITGNSSRIHGLTINRFGVDGIHIIGGDSNVITNNYIGVDVTGMIAYGNLRDGILLDNTTNTMIGGANSTLGNIISGNAANGLEIGGFNGSGAANTTVQNNLIGVNVNATSALGNGALGIWALRIATTNLIIGGGAGLGNIVAGNTTTGILISPNVSSSVISFNAIGTDFSGARVLGNGTNGIFVHGSNIDVTSNLVANNGSIGIYVFSPATDVRIQNNTILSEPRGVVVAGTAVGVSITNNTMSGVAQLIDLGNDGVTVNDAGDIDVGSNDLLNTPILTSAASDGVGLLRLAGTFNGQPNRTLQIDLYEHGTTGMSQRSVFIGSLTITTDALGNASAIQSLSGIYAIGTIFSATATDITSPTNRSTSEHSNALVAQAPAILTSPTSGLVVNEAGTSTTVSFVLSTAPTADVTFNLATSIAGEISLSSTSFNFTAANWNIPQILTITGLQDFVQDGNRLVTIITSNAISADLVYSNAVISDITVTNQAIPNIAPVITAPASYSITEDIASNLGGSTTGLTVSDIDAGNNLLSVTLSITNGFFSLRSTAGLSFSVGDGAADSMMVFQGSAAAINSAIDAIAFAPTANFFGTANLSITVDDLGNTGLGGALSASRVIPVNVIPVNDAPLLTGTKTASVFEGGSVVMTSAMFRLSDIENAPPDLVFTIVANSGDGEFTRSGVSLRTGDSFSQADINAQLIQFIHFGGEAANASVLLGASERFGLSLPDFTMSFSVTPVNDAPTITALTGGLVSEIAVAGALVADVSASDVDNATGLTFTLVNDAQGTFQINSVTGEITVRDATKIDFETAQQLTIRVKATDISGAFAERDFTIQVGDIPEFVIIDSGGTGGTNGTNGTNGPGANSGQPPSDRTNIVDQTNSPANPRADILVASAIDAARSSSTTQDGDGRRGTQSKSVSSRDKEVWIDLNNTTGNGKKKSEVGPRSVTMSLLEQQDEAYESNRRRTLNSDSLDYLLNSGRKAKNANNIPPRVLLSDFKLPANAQSRQIDENSIDKPTSNKTFSVVIDTIEYGGMALSVGAVAWATRAGGLIAALLSAIPAWKGLDPLLVLSPSKASVDREKEFEEFSDTVLRGDEEAVRAVLE